MSIPVPLARLARTMQDHHLAYLLTVSDGERAHAVAVHVEVVEDGLRVPALGRRSLANCAQRQSVTLLWPPADADGYTLIVDGTVEPAGDGVLVTPTRAVLHRAAAPPDPPASNGDACVSDCVELPLGTG